VQGESADTIRPITALLAGAANDVLAGCWGGGGGGAADCAALLAERAVARAHSLAGTGFSEGRNRNQRALGELELANGYLHEFVVHWDEDVSLLGACHAAAAAPAAWVHAPLPDGYAAGATARADYGGVAAGEGAPCFRAMEAWALALLAPLLVPQYGGAMHDPTFAVARNYNFDSMSVYLHRRAVDVLLPYETMFERYSYYTGACSMNHLAGTLFPGRNAASSLLWSHNPRHRDYPKGVGYALHCSMGLRWFMETEGFVGASMERLILWDNEPTRITERQDEATAAWGSLDWADAAGRGGAAVERAAVAVDAERAGDWTAAGVVGGQPRAAPPYSAVVHAPWL
jgi:hypothetical protein